MTNVYTKRGGLAIGKWFGFRATWPLAKIEIYEEKLIIKCFLHKSIEFNKEDIISISKYLRFPILVDGVLIKHKKKNINSFILFWSISSSKLLKKFKEFNYKTD